MFKVVSSDGACQRYASGSFVLCMCLEVPLSSQNISSHVSLILSCALCMAHYLNLNFSIQYCIWNSIPAEGNYFGTPNRIYTGGKWKQTLTDYYILSRHQTRYSVSLWI